MTDNRSDPSPSPTPSPGPTPQPPAAAVPVLGYQATRSGRGVTVAWCADAVEAELLCNELKGAGVAAAAVNEHVAATLGAYGFVKVEVQVAAEDRERAAEVLARLPGRNDVEPAEEPSDGSADFTHDDSGGRLPLAVAAEFPTAQEMLEASAALGSARVQTFLPDLVPRRPTAEPDDGERPRRTFRVRVLEEDLQRARRVLDEASGGGGDDEEGDEPRCPKCASWRVYGTSRGLWNSLLRLIGGGGARGKTWECLRCGFRWGGDGSPAGPV